MIWRLIIVIALCVSMVYSCNVGIKREMKRRCVVAKEHCRLYADKGACDPKYMKVCELP